MNGMNVRCRLCGLTVGKERINLTGATWQALTFRQTIKTAARSRATLARKVTVTRKGYHVQQAAIEYRRYRAIRCQTELDVRRSHLSEVNIRLRDNGPLVVEGKITITDAEGNEFPVAPDKPAVALCRCGGSQNKPFCDGSHKSTGFESADRAPSS